MALRLQRVGELTLMTSSARQSFYTLQRLWPAPNYREQTPDPPIS